MGLLTRRILTVSLLAVGAALIAILPAGPVAFGGVRWAILGACVLVALVPAVHLRLAPVLERLRRPDDRTRRRAAMAIAIAAGGYFLLTAVLQDRDFFPKTYDDQAYLLQMRLLSTGRLWLPPHPLGDFFDSVHVTIEPVYAVAYFPGTAMMFVPALWLGLPPWLGPLLASAACVALVYLIVTDLADGLAGLLAALAMVSLSWFRLLSILLMSQVPALLLGLLMVWAWLRWRAASSSGAAYEESRPVAATIPGRGLTSHRERPDRDQVWSRLRRGFRSEWAWLTAIGAFAGWMAITRPVDAVAYALPVGVAIVLDLARARVGALRWAASLGAIVLAATPFLAVQLIFNRGVTGSFAQTPFGHYIDRDQPQTSLGFHDFDPSRRPRTVVPQKQALYEEFIVPRIRRHTPAELPRTWAREYAAYTIDTTLPARPLLVLVPLGLLALATDRRRLVLLATLPAFLALYALYTFYLEHYAVVVAPAVLLLMVLALPVLERAWPRRRAAIASALAVFVAVSCVLVLPEVDRALGSPGGRAVSDEPFQSPMMRSLRTELPGAVEQPAVVLVRWAPGELGGRTFEVPVYNTDAAWPDDAPLIFAHDLGPERNRQIVEYYAQRQPQRMFYLFDRSQLDSGGEPFRELGTAERLARALRSP